VSVAFDVVFSVFVASIAALAVIAVRWGVRRDRLTRARRAQPPPDPNRVGAPGSPPDGRPA
jgi:hypothetical protein